MERRCPKVSDEIIRLELNSKGHIIASSGDDPRLKTPADLLYTFFGVH
jgi:hypothetical protein